MDQPPFLALVYTWQFDSISAILFVLQAFCLPTSVQGQRLRCWDLFHICQDLDKINDAYASLQSSLQIFAWWAVPEGEVYICRTSVRKSGKCKVLPFASVVPMQLVQERECRACYWGINNEALSSSNTHTRIDCYLCFAFSFLWLLLHNSIERTAKWIELSCNWYAANVLKYLCSNRFCSLVCLVSTEVGEGSLPVAWAEEHKASIPFLIFLAVVLQPQLHSKLQRYNLFCFYKSL